MDLALTPPAGVTIVALVLAGLFAAILPTCLYLYVEPRGRKHWGIAGDTPPARRAPALVRLTAWLSFALGQLALPWLLVPVGCGGLLYVQVRLGSGWTGMAVTAALGVAALGQAVLGLRLLPMGVRLLARDAATAARAAGGLRGQAVGSAVLLGVALLLGAALSGLPSAVHPVLRATLAWAVLRPVLAYGAACLLHAALLARCAPLLRSR